MVPLIVIAGLAIAAIALAGNKGKGKSAYQILIQTPAAIPASEAMIANALGMGPNDLMSMSSPAMGQLIVRGKMTPPNVGTTINFFGVPGTIMQVEAIPGG